MAEDKKIKATVKEEKEAAPAKEDASAPVKETKPVAKPSKATFDTKDVLELIEIAAAPSTMGKIKKGVNEVTKAIERGNAKLVITADDVSPAEIIQHIPLLCKEKGIKHVSVPSKAELGNAAGLKGCTSIAIISAGESEGKEILMKIVK